MEFNLANTITLGNLVAVIFASGVIWQKVNELERDVEHLRDEHRKMVELLFRVLRAGKEKRES